MDASPNSRSIAQLPKNPQACRTDPPTPSMVCKPLERRVAWLQDWDWERHILLRKSCPKRMQHFCLVQGFGCSQSSNNQKEIVLGYEGFCRKVAPPQLSDAHFVQLDSRKGITIDIRDNGHLANNKQVGVRQFCIESSSYPSWRELITLSVLPLVGSPIYCQQVELDSIPWFHREFDGFSVLWATCLEMFGTKAHFLDGFRRYFRYPEVSILLMVQKSG